MTARGTEPATREAFLTENDVVQAVAAHLKAQGWTVLKARSTGERGVDIVAERGGDQLFVEAKGGGSAQPTSRRYGQSFHNLEKRHNVAEAIFKALLLREAHSIARVALAFPDDATHRRWLGAVKENLRVARIDLFWVAADRAVTTAP